MPPITTLIGIWLGLRVYSTNSIFHSSKKPDMTVLSQRELKGCSLPFKKNCLSINPLLYIYIKEFIYFSFFFFLYLSLFLAYPKDRVSSGEYRHISMPVGLNPPSGYSHHLFPSTLSSVFLTSPAQLLGIAMGI